MRVLAGGGMQTKNGIHGGGTGQRSNVASKARHSGTSRRKAPPQQPTSVSRTRRAVSSRSAVYVRKKSRSLTLHERCWQCASARALPSKTNARQRSHSSASAGITVLPNGTARPCMTFLRTVSVSTSTTSTSRARIPPSAASILLTGTAKLHARTSAASRNSAGWSARNGCSLPSASSCRQ